MNTIAVSNLEEAALLLVSGYELQGSRVNQRGFVDFDFPEEALFVLEQYRTRDVSIPSLRQFSRAHKNLRALITQLRQEARGISNEQQSPRLLIIPPLKNFSTASTSFSPAKLK